MYIHSLHISLVFNHFEKSEPFYYSDLLKTGISYIKGIILLNHPDAKVTRNNKKLHKYITFFKQ